MISVFALRRHDDIAALCSLEFRGMTHICRDQTRELRSFWLRDVVERVVGGTSAGMNFRTETRPLHDILL